MGRGRFAVPPNLVAKRPTLPARAAARTVFLITVDIRRALLTVLRRSRCCLQGHSLRLAYRPSTAGQLSETQVTSKVLLLIIALVLCRLSLILLYGLTDVKIRQAIG